MRYEEKRRDPRIKCIKPIDIKCIGSDGKIRDNVAAILLDISKGGIKIASPIAFETNLIMISTLDMNNKTCGVRGEIVHSEKQDSGEYLMGIKFKAPESSCLKFIRAVVRTHFFDIHSNSNNLSVSMPQANI